MSSILQVLAPIQLDYKNQLTNVDVLSNKENLPKIDEVNFHKIKKYSYHFSSSIFRIKK